MDLCEVRISAGFGISDMCMNSWFSRYTHTFRIKIEVCICGLGDGSVDKMPPIHVEDLSLTLRTHVYKPRCDGTHLYSRKRETGDSSEQILGPANQPFEQVRELLIPTAMLVSRRSLAVVVHTF